MEAFEYLFTSCEQGIALVGDISSGWRRVYTLPFAGQIINCRADALHYVFKGIVKRGPPGDRFRIGGQHLEFGEWRVLQIGRTQENGDNTCLVGVVPGDGLIHLDTVAEVRGHKVGAHQQEDDLGTLEALYNLWLPLCPRNNIPVIPGDDEILPLEVTQVFLQFFAQFLIPMGVGDEDL